MYPLLVVASLGFDGGVSKLLQVGADVAHKNPQDGSTALHFATKGCHVDIMKKLIQAGSCLNTPNEVDYSRCNCT